MRSKIPIYASLFFVACLLLLFTNCSPNNGQIKPPETKIETRTQKFGSGEVKIAFSGKDERTPEDKLTYAYWLYTIKDPAIMNAKSVIADQDKKIVIEATTTTAEAVFSGKVLDEGVFLLSVVAINEFGLADESPAESTFFVDLTPPQLPELSVMLKEGNIISIASYKETPSDFFGFEFFAYSESDAKKSQQSTSLWTYKAKFGELYEIQVRAYDDVGNYSQTISASCDATQDKEPVLVSSIPVLLGSKTNVIELEYYDDWDKTADISKNATLSSTCLKTRDNGFVINHSMLSEGTETFLLVLKDKNGHVLKIERDLFIDLTPPEIPENVSIENLSTGYQISWGKKAEAAFYGVYGSNDGNDWELIDTTPELKLYSPGRFLHFAVSAIDLAGNESHVSYPIRTYDEMYSPVVSSDVTAIEGNTLLTTLFSPYTIRTHLLIPEGVSLAFERGVEVVFETNGSLEIDGELISIPSRTERYSEFRMVKDTFSEPVFTIGKGNIWLEKIRFNEDNNEGTLFSMNRYSSVMVSDALIKGFSTVVSCTNSDNFQITESRIETLSFASGESLKNLKITNSEITAVNGISLNNVQNLFLSEATLVCTDTLLKTNGLSNIKIENSRLSSMGDGIQAAKLTVIDLFASDIFVKNTALSINGASSLNMRKTVIDGSNTGIYASQSSYVSVSESDIENCSFGVIILNSDLSINDTAFTKNATAIELQGRNTFEQVKVAFSENSVDVFRYEP
jgi:hypothetical protein